MRRLYEFTRRLSGLASFDAVAEGAASEIHASLGRAVVVLLEHDGDLKIRLPGLAARRYPRCCANDGGALGLQPWRTGRRRHQHVTNRAVVLRAAADRQKDAGRDRRCQAARDDAARR